MRILYVTDALAVWGGIERVLCDKTNYLVEHYGYDVYIVTTDQGDHPIPYPLDDRIHVQDLKIKLHSQYKHRGLKRLYAYRKLNLLFLNNLKTTIENISPDIIVCIKLDFISTIIKAKNNIPLLCESHSMCYSTIYDRSSVWNRIKHFYIRRIIKNADCIVALTEGDANDWRNYTKHVCVIPNVVQLNHSGRYSLLNSKRAIFVGRFSSQKDVWSLLKIWCIVQLRHPDWELHVYGEGEDKAKFESVVKEKDLHIRVFEPTSQIFDKYLDSSLLLLTSRYEPFGLVLPEAMSCGLPVVAFNCPYGPADIITNGFDGFLIERHNIVDFAEKICQLIEDKSLRQRMGHRAKDVSCRYTEEKIMPQWVALFEKIQLQM